MASDKAADFWLGVWPNPRISAAIEDQRAFEETTLPSLKRQLASQFASNHTDYFAPPAAATCAKQLQTTDTRVS